MARRWLREQPPLPPSRLEALLAAARPLLDDSEEQTEAAEDLATTARSLSPGAERDRAVETLRRTLLDAYLAMVRAETDLCIVLEEAHEGRRRSHSRQERRHYRRARDRAWERLARVGRSYAAKCPLFQYARNLDASWPPMLEEDDRGRFLYHNTFKRSPERLLLPPELAQRYQPNGPAPDAVAREQLYRQELRDYLSRGGRMEDLVDLRPRLLKRIEAGDRYEYVLRADERLRVCRVTKDIGFTPGHSLLAERSAEFRGELALSAGEFWVLGDGETLIFNVGSGHFVPYFDALTSVREVVEQLDEEIKHDFRFVAYGGPSSGRKAARHLGEALGQSKAAARAVLPPRVWERRAALHQQPAVSRRRQ